MTKSNSLHGPNTGGLAVKERHYDLLFIFCVLLQSIKFHL